MFKKYPYFSIIIPVYNAEEYLKQCLDSVINQTFEDIEIICVNDASTDNSLKILEEYQKQEQRIVVINNEKNIGSGNTRNKAIKLSRGKYIGFVDSDDFVELNWLESIYKRIQKTKPDCIAFDADYFDIKCKTYCNLHALNHAQIPQKTTFSPKEFPDSVLQFFTSATWGRIYNKKFITKNNIHFAPVSRSDDQSFTIIACLLSKKITIIDQVFYHRIFMPDSLTNSGDLLWRESYRAYDYTKRLLLQKKIYHLYEKTFLIFLLFQIEYYLLQKVRQPTRSFVKLYYSQFIHDQWNISSKAENYFPNYISNLIKSFRNLQKNLLLFESLYNKSRNKIIPIIYYINPSQTWMILEVVKSLIMLSNKMFFLDIYILGIEISDRMQNLIENLPMENMRIKYIKIEKQQLKKMEIISLIPRILFGYDKAIYLKKSKIPPETFIKNISDFLTNTKKSQNKFFKIVDLKKTQSFTIQRRTLSQRSYPLFSITHSRNDFLNTPLISIIVPIKTRLDYFKPCIFSLLEQTFSNFELICIIDGVGECDKFLIELSQKDTRIKPYFFKESHGAGYCRNYGISKAGGKYILFLDSDDFFDRSMLEKMYLQAKVTLSDIIICSAYTFDNKTHKISPRPWTLITQGIKQPVFSKDSVRNIFKVTTTCVWNKLYSLEFVKKNHLKFQNISSCNDAAFSLLSLVLANKISYINEALIYYRANQTDNITAKRDIFNSLKVCSFIQKEFQKRIYLRKYKKLLEVPFENLLNYELSFPNKLELKYRFVQKYVKFLLPSRRKRYIKQIKLSIK